jgi:hypothetical protein
VGRRLKLETDRSLKHALCGKGATWFEGLDSGLKYVRRLFCYDRLCPVCGNKGGAIHKRRKRRLIDAVKRLYGSLVGLGLRKFVFTLPADLRGAMRSKVALNKFFIVVEKIMKARFPGRLIEFELHLFGDKDKDFKPHLNAQVVERLGVRGGRMKLSKEDLAAIKADYVRLLVKEGYDVSAAGVNYGFTLDKSHFLHCVNYVTRPCPDEKMLTALKIEDPGLFDFLLSDVMKGFQFIRNTRGLVDADQFVEGDGVIQFERMRYIEKTRFCLERFTDTYRVHERMEVYPGLYACRSGGLTPEDRKRFAGCEDG